MIVVFLVSVAAVAWVYVGYPLTLAALARARPRPRRRAPVTKLVSVVIAAHNEEAVIAGKVADIRASSYPADQIEIIVASDGSDDGTVAAAAGAGGDEVLDLPRVGKVRALLAGVERARGEILVFSDADSKFEPATLDNLVANFADSNVGAVAAHEVHVRQCNGALVGQGEGLYWRYENWIKRAEDRVGSAVSAGGRLYALRRELFRAPSDPAYADDFAISTSVIASGHRLAFDRDTRVIVQLPTRGRAELRRKVRVMNGGLRAAFALVSFRLVREHPWYTLQLLSHKILRRFVGFFLATMFIISAFGAATNSAWWIALAPECVFYCLAAGGAASAHMGLRSSRLLAIPYYFCLATVAAAIAVMSIVAGVRYEKWQPEPRATAATEAI